MKRRKTDLAETLTTKEAAEALQVSPRTIRRMIERGTLNATKLDPYAKSVYRISRADVEKILQARNPTADASQ